MNSEKLETKQCVIDSTGQKDAVTFLKTHIWVR